MRVQIESKVTEDLCDICIDREDLCSNNDSEMRDLTLKVIYFFKKFIPM